MEDIIISLESAFHRVERFILWHNRYASLLAFFLGHCIFYAIARAGLRPFCAITLVLLIFHILDCLKKKRLNDEEKNLSELTQLVLRLYRHLWRTHEKFNTIKTENRMKYSIIIIIICLILAYIGVKINGFYVSYITMLILFTLPAIVYHKLIPKLIKRLAPILEQLDQSMEYKRRTLIDRKDLLVKIKTPGLNEYDDDDEDIRKLQQQQDQMRTKSRSLITPDEENEQNLISTNDENEPIIYSRQNSSNLPKQTNTGDSTFDTLSNSSSSTADDDETARISELYANVSDRIDGKHRIKIKGDEIKIKGSSNKPRSKIMDTNFFQSNNTNMNKFSATPLINTNNEPDLTSFDFLNDYEDKS